jgi:hypothetical protein
VTSPGPTGPETLLRSEATPSFSLAKVSPDSAASPQNLDDSR